jgi:hypothetical protein
MSKTSNTKQITKIVIDEANGLTHVYMSDLSPKIVKANTSAPTNIPTKSEFSFRDESVESQAVVEKVFDEVFPEEDGHPQLFCPICGGLLREARRGNYVFVECMSCELAVLGDDSDDYEEAKEKAWLTARQFIEELPPVLRLQPGSEIQYFDGMFRRHTGIVAGRTRVSMRILLEDGRSIEPGNIVEWPWGMEQAE